MGDIRQFSRWALVAVLGCFGADTAFGFGRITHKTEIRDYRVYGTTPKALVSYMRARPFHGDNGAALANIRPRYSLSVQSRSERGQCRIRSINLSIRFVVTLPRAMDRKRFSRGTAAAWRAFRGFARRHELVHRRYYLRCARRFLRKARRLGGKGGCFGIHWKARSLLDAEDKACNRLHDAFDRRDAPRVLHLSLFRRAYGNRYRKVSRRSVRRKGRSYGNRRKGRRYRYRRRRK